MGQVANYANDVAKEVDELTARCIVGVPAMKLSCHFILPCFVHLVWCRAYQRAWRTAAS